MGYPPMGLLSEFRFGKHKGSTVEEVIETDPSYLRWALDGNVITLDNEAFAEYQPAIEEYELSEDFFIIRK